MAIKVEVPTPEGITYPPIDDLLEKSESKYSLVILAAKRARQINAYYSQLSEGLLQNVGPLVETHMHEKPLSIAFREIAEGLVEATPFEPGSPATDPQAVNGLVDENQFGLGETSANESEFSLDDFALDGNDPLAAPEA